MECMKFNIKGETGFLKNPLHNLDNENYTYPNIHYIAVKGIVGAMLGLKGWVYNYVNEKEYIPQFYRELKDLKISIVPNVFNFDTKFITINNATGFGNSNGHNNPITQNIKEQWLMHPSWDIYIQNENKYYNEIKQRLVEGNFVYDLYIGRRGHQAEISKVEEIKMKEVKEDSYIQSLFLNNEFEIINGRKTYDNDSVKIFSYMLPLQLQEELQNMYDIREFKMTNLKVKNEGNNKIYKCNNETNIVFY